ncbi:unnamed protein product [Parascedosporium putredinis]|uniref:EKC/KEOPS complex subunit GON7 n=1 Tax=Parascedosporium putredinis TaxID=1442378 RepID=A0A9P1MF30_9PEZI|nr:unnamed protein product [Parascedosporium putredinis]CAI8004135.1 unnamed protein product [Parascedosporium putredinis]
MSHQCLQPTPGSSLVYRDSRISNASLLPFQPHSNAPCVVFSLTLDPSPPPNLNLAHSLPLVTHSPAETMSSTTQPSFTATYSSPTSEPFTASHSVSAEIHPEHPGSYLAALRAAAASAQDDINRELTRRMDEDKAREAGAAAGASTDEAKEEENYGEEVVEEDE